MHGTVPEVFVEPGQSGSAGTRLAVLEAMKMQHDILVPVNHAVSDDTF